jgi:OOP family OmpA-OmpF porin
MRWLTTIALLLGVSTAATAQAQNLAAQRFAPAGSEDGVLGVEGADLRRLLHPYVALWAHYALDPLVVEQDDDETAIVEHVLGADLVFSIAVWEGLEFGALLPVTLLAKGDEDAATAVGLVPMDGASMGDLSLRVAYRFELSYRDALALHVPVYLPTAPDDDLLASGFGVKPTMAYTHGFEHADLTFNLSYLFRDDVEVGDYHGGQELGLHMGTRIGVDPTWDTAIVASIGVDSSLHDFFGAAETPVEPQAGVEHWFGQHWRLGGFLGTGLSRGIGAPDLRVGLSIAFGEKPARPRREGDRDSDGIPDENDACPHDAEDRDGFADEDGCPDEDNDNDGILDEDDACPSAPETPDGIADEDGCPDRIRVEGALITTFEPVQFKTDSDEILPESHPMLREVSNVMKTNPGMEIHVAGHSDSTGDAEYNRELSDRRAHSVRKFIIEQGVDDDRLDAKGYGEDQPVADNESEEGRRKNRRVEFQLKGRQ